MLNTFLFSLPFLIWPPALSLNFYPPYHRLLMTYLPFVFPVDRHCLSLMLQGQQSQKCQEMHVIINTSNNIHGYRVLFLLLLGLLFVMLLNLAVLCLSTYV